MAYRHVDYVSLLYTTFMYDIRIYYCPLSQAGCSALTALLHYFLLAAFCWMLCEGVMMYVLLVRVFGAHEKKWLVLYLSLGWGETMNMYIHLHTVSTSSMIVNSL